MRREGTATNCHQTVGAAAMAVTTNVRALSPYGCVCFPSTWFGTTAGPLPWNTAHIGAKKREACKCVLCVFLLPGPGPGPCRTEQDYYCFATTARAHTSRSQGHGQRRTSKLRERFRRRERERPKESAFERRVPQYSRFVSQPCRGVVVHGQTPRREGSVSEITALTKRAAT